MTSSRPPDVVIRPANGPEELRVCAALMAASEPWLTLKRGSNQALKMLGTPGLEVYIARVGAAQAGHVAVNMQGPFAGYIQVIAVVAEWRSQGIGAQMLRFAEERIFRDSPNVFLCVSDFNPRAQKLYRRLGYERIGELKDYVIPGASEILMRKTIGPKTDFKPRPA